MRIRRIEKEKGNEKRKEGKGEEKREKRKEKRKRPMWKRKEDERKGLAVLKTWSSNNFW